MSKGQEEPSGLLIFGTVAGLWLGAGWAVYRAYTTFTAFSVAGQGAVSTAGVADVVLAVGLFVLAGLATYKGYLE